MKKEKKLKKYIVQMREVHISTIEVEAENEQEAKEKAGDGDGNYYDGLEYSHSLDEDTWTVEEIE